ncbi:MdtA/MuxA family multidrug efflux RND transporter periplasmic adaptor subunit [Erwinia endophytica]|uniref:MdtA/MuxA family multidrug efflux RND transporter periplasmic adaptor subunit n=1 Tax=Erwinia endophytica TaxID=1563158 RepID=UPI001265E7AD|nr:MdtA/MuxA family multidrug efflux RND transporter periplasmic adaptor subunit [Erwinia endophytica]KAB8307331.1 MdtA/MuxA family multidrug efflux RND transporter periplasmic adaptor subunit [Erwinia endophytica]
MNRQRRFRKIVFIVVATVLAVGGWYGYSRHNATVSPTTASAQPHAAGVRKNGERRGGSGALAPVQAIAAVRQNVPHYLSGLGTVTAANTVTLRSRVDGNLVALHFMEGQEVQAGQLLAEIDPRPYQVALIQAQGQLAKDQATLENARRDLARYEKLAKTNLVSQQEIDNQRSLVNETLGTIKMDEGSVASAQLNLTYSRVTSPISGRVGLRQTDTGNYITSSDSIVVITQTHPIDLVFSLPENDIGTLLNAQKTGQPIPVEAWDRNNKTLLTHGTLLSMDNQIDSTTGMVKLKARFSNSDNLLFPNQFVNARLQVSTQQDAIVIPAAALQMGNEGHFVWVVNEDHKVSKKQVSTGLQDSEKVVITAGLDVGERVVTDGIDRLTEGATVDVVDPLSSSSVSGENIPPAKGSRS